LSEHCLYGLDGHRKKRSSVAAGDLFVFSFYKFGSIELPALADLALGRFAFQISGVRDLL